MGVVEVVEAPPFMLGHGPCREGSQGEGHPFLSSGGPETLICLHGYCP